MIQIILINSLAFIQRRVMRLFRQIYTIFSLPGQLALQLKGFSWASNIARPHATYAAYNDSTETQRIPIGLFQISRKN